MYPQAPVTRMVLRVEVMAGKGVGVEREGKGELGDEEACLVGRAKFRC